MSFLVDTNIISELVRPRPNPGVVTWAGQVSTFVVSAVTVDEIFFGLSWKPNRRVGDWFETFIREDCDVLPVTGPVAARSGRLRGELRARWIVGHQADMLIAATAQVHQLTLVTHNARDFDGCGMTVLDPFC